MAGLRERMGVEKETFEPHSVPAPPAPPLLPSPVNRGPWGGGEEEQKRVASSSLADERDTTNASSSTSNNSSTSNTSRTSTTTSTNTSRHRGRPSLVYAKSLLEAFREFR